MKEREPRCVIDQGRCKYPEYLIDKAVDLGHETSSRILEEWLETPPYYWVNREIPIKESHVLGLIYAKTDKYHTPAGFSEEFASQHPDLTKQLEKRIPDIDNLLIRYKHDLL